MIAQVIEGVLAGCFLFGVLYWAVNHGPQD